MRCYLSPLRWRKFCLSARVWCNVFAFFDPAVYMTALAWTLLTTFSHFISALCCSGFWKTHNRKLQQRRVIFTSERTCWFTRVDQIGWRAAGWERRDTRENNSLISILSCRWPCTRLITRFLFLSCTLEQPRPHSPARMDSVGICRNADRPWESDTGRGLLGWPGERTVELKAG